VIIPAGCTLNLNGLNLYARAVQMAGTVLNGTINQLPNAGALTLNTPTPGDLSTPGELDEWTFFGQAGRTISILVNPGPNGAPAAISPQLEWVNVVLLDSSNNVLASGSDTSAGGMVSLSNIVLPADGTYKIHVNAAAVQISSTGNYIVSAWDVTPNIQTLNVGTQSTGDIATPFALDEWNFSGLAGQQIQFELAATSASGLVYSLTGPGGYVAFQNITGSSNLIDLPASGNYTLTVYGVNGATGAYSFQIAQTSVTPLTSGVVYSGTWAGSGQAQLFSIPVTGNNPLSLVLNDSNSADHTEIYARFGSPPTRQTFDYGMNGSGASHSLLVPSATAGTWYVLVYGESIPSSSGNYTLQATSSEVVLLGTPTTQSAANVNTTLTLNGAGFNSGSKVTLVSSTGAVFNASTSTTDLPTQITATFTAGTLPAGTYTVVVTQADGSSASLPSALTIATSGTPNLVTSLTVPNPMTRHIALVMYVNYANTGNAPMPAPLLILNATNPLGQSGALMTLNPALQTSGFWTSATPAGYSQSVQILASGSTPGILQPGESMSVPVYYGGWLTTQWDFSDNTLNFSLTTLKADDTTQLNWASEEASLQPPAVSGTAWQVVYSSLISETGTTSGGFVQLLDNEATYLSQLGENITDVGTLWNFAVSQAKNIWPTPTLGAGVDDSLPVSGAIPLALDRDFNQSIPGRFQSGPLGFGWFTSWQQSLTIGADGSITLTTGNGAQYIYQPDSRYPGQYFSQPGDNNTFAAVSGGYTLTAVNGDVTAFNANGSLNYVQDTNGNTITASYTGSQLSSLTASSGQSVTFTYNAAGLIATATDSAGRVTSYTYDAANQHLMSVLFYNGETISYSYNTTPGSPSQNSLASITFPDGTHSYLNYDDEGRLASTSADGGAEPETLTYTYGQVGVTNGVGGTTNYYYNENGQLATAEDPVGRTVFYDYDSSFNLSKVTNDTGASATYSYNGIGEATSVTDFLGNTTSFVYGGPQNQLSALTDARKNTTLYGYNSAGNLLATTFANGESESLTYDPLGNALSFLNAAGQPIQFAYNGAGQLTSATFSDGSRYTYVYDTEGKLTSAVDTTGTTTFSYDATSRLLNEVAYPNGKSLAFNYDSGGRRVQMTDQDGFAIHYGYDAVGRLATLTDSGSNAIVSYTYDPAGRLSQKSNGNGTRTVYQYCVCGELTQIINYAPGGGVNSQFDYTYDSLGLMATAITLDGTWTYTHDADGQLTQAVFASKNTANIPNQDILYAYDVAGNRISTVINGVTTAYTANNINEYTNVGGVTYSYDPNGNLLSDGINTYTYDSLNNLTSIVSLTGTTSFTYNALGQRVSLTGGNATTQYLIDPVGLGNVVGTFDASGGLIAHYDYGLGLISQIAGGTSDYYDYDQLGSTVGLSNTGGSYVNTYSYLPFGGSLLRETNVNNPFQFLGTYGVMASVPTVDLTYARAYSETTGRFDSCDPLGLYGGDINLYRYSRNNPNAMIDPMGLNAFSISYDQYDGFGGGFTFSVGEGQLCLGVHVGIGVGGGYSVGYSQHQGNTGFDGPSYSVDYGGVGANYSRDNFGINGPTQKAGLKVGASATVGYTQCAPYPWPFGSTTPPIAQNPTPTPPGGTNSNNTTTTTVNAEDPNSLYGPSGYGVANYVTDMGGKFAYRITFENDPTATAPAQVVTITDNLDPNLNWSTFQLTGVGFGDNNISIPSGSQHFETTVQMTYNGQTFNVQIEAGIHSDTGQVYATFESIDPSTGLPPVNVLVGFLPPEDGTGRGEGYLSFTVSPKSNLVTGTVIPNVAAIVFDDAEPILTDLVNDEDPSEGVDPTKEAQVTIDANIPTAQMNPLPANSFPTIGLSWSGSDGSNGSGIAGYTIYVSSNGGQTYSPWLSNTTQTSAIFTGTVGTTYSFYVDAISNVDNVEQVNPQTAAVSTTVVPPPTVTITSVPPFGSTGLLTGTVSLVTSPQYYVQTYLYVDGAGWWSKTLTPINANGTFSADLSQVVGGSDEVAEIFCAAVVSGTPAAVSGAVQVPPGYVAIAYQEQYGKTLTFAGHTWAVKKSLSPVGPYVSPGPGNYFSDQASDVWVDAAGSLHLTVHQESGQWYSTEVILLDHLGNGTYSFQTDSRTDQLDPNLTFGMFTWDDYGDNDSGGSPNREIDIEDSLWGLTSGSNSQYVVQPSTISGNRYQFDLPDLSGSAALTRVFSWQPETVGFWTLQGAQPPSAYLTGTADWTYSANSFVNHYVPAPGREYVHMNLWLSGTTGAPANGQPAEVVVTGFNFVPLLYPTVSVQEPAGIPLSSGSSTVSFGSVLLGTSNQLTFTVVNSGSGAATLDTLMFGGSNASDFSVVSAPVSPLASGSSTTFTLAFSPTVTGSENATLTVNSDDPITPIFQIAVTGTGTVPPTYTVTPSADPTGSISPNTPQIVNSGSSVRFTATPSSGYIVDQWFVNGNAVQTGGTSYLLTDVTSSETVKVTFISELQEIEGGAVPGSSGSSTYVSFGTPQLDVVAGVEKTGKVKESAIFSSTGSVLVETGTGYTKLGQPSGDAVLATDKSGTVLLTGLSTGTITEAASTGRELPETLTIKNFLAIDGNGADTFFLATLQGKGVTAANNIALEAAISGSSQIVARKGEEVTIGGSTSSISTLTTLVGSPGTLADGRWRVDDSDFGIRVTLSNKSEAIFIVPATATSSTNWSLLAQTGAISGITRLDGGVAASFGLPGFSNSTESHLVNLSTKGAGKVAAAGDVALTSGTNLLAQKGSEAPDATGAPMNAVLFKTLSDPVSGANGAIAFEATLTGAAVNASNNSGIWFAANGVMPKLIARTGDSAPGGGHFAKFISMVLPVYSTRSDGPVFLATLAVKRADGVNGRNDLGLWAVDSTGAIHLLFRTGQAVTVGGQSEIVSTFLALDPALGSVGAASGYDSDGYIAIRATFTDGTQALIYVAAP
jgi:RHS repeat-associated protein